MAALHPSSKGLPRKGQKLCGQLCWVTVPRPFVRSVYNHLSGLLRPALNPHCHWEKAGKRSACVRLFCNEGRMGVAKFPECSNFWA